ncbi:hypothetical protein [Endozoicomonas ascidiicola]|uniref:hypothetical protein n=1 Tax=Endozoicomonas ascidiicola TaxID=1698521 RepID=UPI00082DF1C9|nr:hypothetical protein [Endozoicomonas ascidiicola]
MLTDYEMVHIQTPTIDYEHRVRGILKVDGMPFNGVVILLKPPLKYITSGSISNGQLSFFGVPEKRQHQPLNVAIAKDGLVFSQLVETSNTVIYDLAISTNGGGGSPTGDPATITGKVERVLDNQAEPAARQLVAIENKPDGTWAVTGNTVSDTENGSYTLNVLTDGGDTFVMALDDYGQVFTAASAVAQGDLIHPTVPNGHVYSVEVGGTLPETEPQWWEAGSSGIQVVGDVTLRAIPFYRPLVHGYIKASLIE